MSKISSSIAEANKLFCKLQLEYSNEVNESKKLKEINKTLELSNVAAITKQAECLSEIAQLRAGRTKIFVMKILFVITTNLIEINRCCKRESRFRKDI